MKITITIEPDPQPDDPARHQCKINWTGDSQPHVHLAEPPLCGPAQSLGVLAIRALARACGIRELSPDAALAAAWAKMPAEDSAC